MFTIVSLLSLGALGARAQALNASSAGASYDESRALRYVALSQVAYSSAADIQNWNGNKSLFLDGFQVGVVMSSDEKELQGYAGYDSKLDTYVVSFRGTVETDIKDWVANLNAFHTKPFDDLPDVEVHSGFWESYQWFQPQIIKYLSSVSAKSVTTIGHSLGGAMANLCAFDLAHSQGYSDVSTITYGQPRTGNSDYASAFNGVVNSAFHVTHYKDLVPSVPYEYMGYKHCATEIFYPEVYTPGDYTVCDGSGEDNNCMDGVLSDSVDDHLLYLDYVMGS